MKKTIVTIVIAIFVIIAVGLYQYLNTKETNKTTISSVTETSTTTDKDSLAGIDLSFPNATEEIEGLVRMESGDTKLTSQEVAEMVIENGRFLFISKNFYDMECLEKTQNTLLCVSYPVDNFNEFIITNTNRTITLHRYKLTDRFSLIDFNPGMDVTRKLFLSPPPEDHLIQIGIINYADKKEEKERIYYLLDVETGVITELRRDKLKCKLSPDQKTCDPLEPFKNA